MALTVINDLWTPPVWLQAIREQQEKFPSILNSGVVMPSQQIAAVATGAGVSATIPFWKDITDTDSEEIQVESTAPTNVHNITTGLQVCPILNRVKKWGASALSAQVSGGDPLAEITAQMGQNRLKRRQNTLLAILRGIMGTGAQTPDAAQGAVRANRIDRFLEAGASATSTQVMSADLFIDACALMGELKNELGMGAILMHPTVVATLEKADKESFKDGVESGLAFTVRTYRGLPIFTSMDLERAGASSGKVYDTYIFSRAVVGTGDKPQAGDSLDVASLQYDIDRDKNDAYIWDRTRFVMHPFGLKWVGNPAGQSATNAELQTHSNWELVLQSARRVGIVAIRTNA